MRKALCCMLSIIVILSASFSSLAGVSDVEQGTYGGKNYTARISRDSTYAYARLEYQVSAFLEFDGTITCYNYFYGYDYRPFIWSGNYLFMEKDATDISIFGALNTGWVFHEFECDYKINHHLVTTLLV